MHELGWRPPHFLSNVTVELWGGDPEAFVDSDTSGADGGFFFDVSPGDYTIKAEYLGTPLEEAVTLADGEQQYHYR